MSTARRQQAIAHDLVLVAQHIDLSDPHRRLAEKRLNSDLHAIGEIGVNSLAHSRCQGIDDGGQEQRGDPSHECSRMTVPTQRARSSGDTAATRMPMAATREATPTL